MLSDGRNAARIAVEDRRWPGIVAEARWPLVGHGRCPRVAAAIHKLWSDGLGNRSSDRSRRRILIYCSDRQSDALKCQGIDSDPAANIKNG